MGESPGRQTGTKAQRDTLCISEHFGTEMAVRDPVSHRRNEGARSQNKKEEIP